jgi:hypothetical protein
MAASAPTPVMQARGLVKRYGHVTALDGQTSSCVRAKYWP